MARRSSKSATYTPDARHRIVVLYGKENLLLEEGTRALRDALAEEFGGVAVFQFDGEEVELATVLDELRSYGLLESHKLVIVDQADRFLADREGKKDPEEENKKGDGGRNRRAMERYAENPVDHATLLLRATTWNRGKLDKLIDKVGTICKCDSLSDADAVRWAIERAESHHDITIDRAAATLLVERLGTGLTRLDTEIEKLAALAPPGKPITAAIVKEVVGLSREEQAWAIQGAVLSGDRGTALSKVRELLEISLAPDVLLMWSLLDLARKLHLASQLSRTGASRTDIYKALKLWRDAADPIIEAARRHPPRRFAQLLQQGVRADTRTKSGLASSTASLEGFAVTIADSVK